MNFTRRIVLVPDLVSSEAYRSVATHPSLKVAAVDAFTREHLQALTVLLGSNFALHVVVACSDKHRLSQVLGRVEVVLSLFKREFEEDPTIDLQLTVAVEVIKCLYPFNAKKIQSRLIEIRKFLRDFTDWPTDFKVLLEETLVTDNHLNNRFSIHLFTYRA